MSYPTEFPVYVYRRADACPGCGHEMSMHSIENGCHEGYEYDEQGLSTQDGCHCGLTLAQQHGPSHERDIP